MIASGPVHEVATRMEEGALRVLVVGVGNVLRQDDAFGIAVLQYLAAQGGLPAGMRLLESGIAGIRVVQELMEGYDALIIVDAMLRKSAPGSVSILEAQVPDPRNLPFADRNEFLADMHYTNPTRAMMLAKALDKLPALTYIVACEPVRYDDFEMGMSDEAQAAVPVAAQKILALVAGLSSGRRTME